jgi:hypothetical protein
MSTSQGSNDVSPVGFTYTDIDEANPTKIGDVKTGVISSLSRQETVIAVFRRMLKKHALKPEGTSAPWSERMKKVARDSWKGIHNLWAIRWLVWLLQLIPWRPTGAGHSKHVMIDALIDARQQIWSCEKLIDACQKFEASVHKDRSEWILPPRDPEYVIVTGEDDPLTDDDSSLEDDDASSADEAKSRGGRSDKSYRKDMMKLITSLTAAITKSPKQAHVEPVDAVTAVKSSLAKLDSKLKKYIEEGTHFPFHWLSEEYKERQISMSTSHEKRMVWNDEGQLVLRSEDLSLRVDTWSLFCQCFINFLRILSLIDNKYKLIDDRCAFFAWLSNARFPYDKKISYFDRFFFKYSDAICWIDMKNTDASLVAEYLSTSTPRRPSSFIDTRRGSGNDHNGGDDSQSKRKKRDRARDRDSKDRRAARKRAEREADRRSRSPPGSPNGRGGSGKRRLNPSSSSKSGSRADGTQKAICTSCTDKNFVCRGASCWFRHECKICKGNHSLIDHQ